MKTCPICSSECFDDMEVCYGCMHRFVPEEESVQATKPAHSVYSFGMGAAASASPGVLSSVAPGPAASSASAASAASAMPASTVPVAPHPAASAAPVIPFPGNNFDGTVPDQDGSPYEHLRPRVIPREALSSSSSVASLAEQAPMPPAYSSAQPSAQVGREQIITLPVQGRRERFKLSIKIEPMG